ncbi:trk system potassium uptake protein TrkH [Thermotomaculum hydrothermale]|uniref:Trk system potassium uptake protein TrkH n=1 Tax=Thermotomaculum hydrothermale TaxID=981385 RepID=A0A7R6PQA7_9BACT|nr:potassium transporter TrkG [Thermotomaculum hydrothermale]BBB33366.1 trk system potassium uptake protein TrkH [Thermotomaculum hydrothermale]
MIKEFLLKYKLWVTKPESALVISFAIVILAGAILLTLPISSTPGNSTSFLDALFTSTSATCVTGLIVFDTGTHFSIFGQVVILTLIQLGGLGIMTFTAIFVWLSKKAYSVQTHYTIQDTFGGDIEKLSIENLLKFIVSATFTIEGLGAAILFFKLKEIYPTGKALYSAIFHSISAFCNAGFSIYSDSLIQFRQSWITLTTIMLLIIFGGLGYPVLFELREKILGKRKKTSFHTKLVLATTLSLIFGGAFFIWLGDHSLTILDSLFQSVTTRTAGFNSVDIGKLPSSSLFIMIMLMFIGGSPGSCAGGIKTTTFSGYLILVKDWFFGEHRKRLFERKLTQETKDKIKSVITLAFSTVVVSFTILLFSEQAIITTYREAFRNLLFEVVSAFGTVGLSTGITSNLSNVGKLVIIIDMFFGRVGPLAIVTSLLFGRRKKKKIDYPEQKIMIG